MKFYLRTDSGDPLIYAIDGGAVWCMGEDMHNVWRSSEVSGSGRVYKNNKQLSALSSLYVRLRDLEARVQELLKERHF